MGGRLWGCRLNRSQFRLLIVSNRLPVTVRHDGERPRLDVSSGGLVTALSPVAEQQLVTHWIGWTGTEDNDEIKAVLRTSGTNGLVYLPVFLPKDEADGYYAGFSNEILWPLFHDLQSRCNFEPGYWDSYQSVNMRFAKAALDAAADCDLVWVHDYHLMLVGAFLRQLGIRKKLAFFLHIPFPAPDIFEKLPWGRQILHALLQYDLVGFQTRRDRQNFIASARRVEDSLKMHRSGRHLEIEQNERRTLVGAFPISIASHDWKRASESPAVQAKAQRIRHAMAGQQIVLGVDRMDYTKGIPERLQAFECLLKNHPGLRGRISLIQLAVPSREGLSKYCDLRQRVQQLVSRINGHYGEPGWVPVHYLYRHLHREQLLAYYAAADIALITPLKDGMNLVAKEYCMAKRTGDGALILSRFAGAAHELQEGAVLVNPYHHMQVAEAIRRTSLLPEAERRNRMRLLQQTITRNDVFRWCGDFLAAAGLGETGKEAGLCHTGSMRSKELSKIAACVA